jgi:hypothetical protein
VAGFDTGGGPLVPKRASGSACAGLAGLFALACAASCGSDESSPGNPAGSGAGASGGSAGSGGAGASGGSTGSGGAGASGGSGGATGGAGGSGGTAGSGGSSGFGGDEQCATAPTQETCNNCCINTHPEGGEAAIRLTTACVCKAEHCQSDCATTQCATPPVQAPDGSPCATCIFTAIDPANTAGCVDEVVQACQADTDCSAPTTCMQTRGCEGKPQQG